jgi:hypothetical protein
MASPGTGLSPEWDRWFDEAFTDLISSDDELVRAEFEALVDAAERPRGSATGEGGGGAPSDNP